MIGLQLVLTGWHLIGGAVGFVLVCLGAYAVGYLEVRLRLCICRSYHRRTGLHVSDCPRFRR